MAMIFTGGDIYYVEKVEPCLLKSKHVLKFCPEPISKVEVGRDFTLVCL